MVVKSDALYRLRSTDHLLSCTYLSILVVIFNSISPSRCEYFLIDLHSRNSTGKADPEESTILLRFQNVADLSKYIIDTYDRLDSCVQFEIQPIFFEVIVYEKKKNVES